MNSFILSRWTFIALLGLFICLGCGAKGPAPIDPKKTEWLEYYDARFGYSFKYPATYMIVPSGNGEITVKGVDKKIAYRICRATYEEARKRGLWVVIEPVETVYISGGLIAHRYVYDFRERFSRYRTAAYVVEPKEGVMIGLEFRLDKSNDEGALDPGQEEVLRSFIIL